MGELLGRQSGMSHGKGGSMHIFTPSFFGGNGIVGAQVPVGAGVSFAQKYMGEKNATFALYGDGASNQGQVFEAFNMVSRPYSLLLFIICSLYCRLSYGTSPPSSSARTTSMEWEHLPSAAPRTQSTSPVATRSPASRSTAWTSLPPSKLSSSPGSGLWRTRKVPYSSSSSPTVTVVTRTSLCLVNLHLNAQHYMQHVRSRNHISYP